MIFKSTVTINAAVINKGKGRYRFSYRHRIFQAHRHTVVTAQQTFLIAAYTVGSSDIKLLGRRQITGTAPLSVQPSRQHLPTAVNLLVQSIELVFAKILVLPVDVFPITYPVTMFLKNHRAFTVIHHTKRCGIAAYGIINPMDT